MSKEDGSRHQAHFQNQSCQWEAIRGLVIYRLSYLSHIELSACSQIRSISKSLQLSEFPHHAQPHSHFHNFGMYSHSVCTRLPPTPGNRESLKSVLQHHYRSSQSPANRSRSSRRKTLQGGRTPHHQHKQQNGNTTFNPIPFKCRSSEPIRYQSKSRHLSRFNDAGISQRLGWKHCPRT